MEELEQETEQAQLMLRAVEEKKNSYEVRIAGKRDEILQNTSFNEANKENIEGLTQKIDGLKKECELKKALYEKAKEESQKISEVVGQYQEKFK